VLKRDLAAQGPTAGDGILWIRERRGIPHQLSGAPLTAPSIPRSPAEITAGRLSTVLSIDGSPATVDDVDVAPIGPARPPRPSGFRTSLLPEIRSTIEQDLVTTYHRTLLTYGVADYDRHTCWQDYRLGTSPADHHAGVGILGGHRARRRDGAGHVAPRLSGQANSTQWS
jgi:hypothetical protein